MTNAEFVRKRQRALTLLAATDIPKRNYLPPAYPLLWRTGIDIPPPHFLSLQALVLITGIPFGAMWIGIYMMMMMDPQRADVLGCLSIFGLVTLAAGLALSSYYRLGRRRHGLPHWREL